MPSHRWRRIRSKIDRPKADGPQIEIVTRDAQLAIVALRGELDITNGLELSTTLQSASGSARMIVDLSAATFMDSTVVAKILVASARALEQQGRPVILVVPPATKLRISHFLGLHQIVAIHPTLDEALAAIQGVE